MDILTNKSFKEYDKLSRYLNTPYYYHIADNKFITGISSRLNKNTGSQSYTTKLDDTLDSISLQFYGDPTYYWIIADYNNILDAFVKLPEGIVLKIPVLSNIEQEA